MSQVRIIDRLPEFASGVAARGARAVTQALVIGGSELPALVPVDTSTLLNSQYRHVDQRGTAIVGTVGFTAEYAKFVHDAPGVLKGKPRPNGHGFYWGPHDGQPQFLVKAFERAKPRIDAVMRAELKA